MARKAAKILSAAALFGVAWASRSQASTYIYAGGNNGSWPVAASWTPTDGGTTYPQTGDTANFSAGITTPTNVLLNGNQDVTNLIFSTTSAATMNVSAGTGGILTIDAGGTITRTTGNTGTTGVDNIFTGVTFAGNATVSQASTSAFANANTAGIDFQGPVVSNSGTTLTLTDPSSTTVNTGFAVEFNASNPGFAGNIDVLHGIFLPNAAGSLLATTTVTLENGTGINWDGTSPTAKASYNIATGANVIESLLSGYTMPGPLYLGNNSTFTLTTGGGNGLTFSNVVSGADASAKLVATDGGVGFSGTASNTFNGTYNFSSGQVAADNLGKTGGAIAVDGPVIFTNNTNANWGGNNEILTTDIPLINSSLAGNGKTTLLSLKGFNQSFGGLTDGGQYNKSGTIQNNASTGSILTLNLASTNSFYGILQDGGSGKLNLAITGTGKQILAGTSTYTGTTTITGGTLSLASTGALGATSINVSGGTFAPAAGSSVGGATGTALLTLGSGGLYDTTGITGQDAFTLNAASTGSSAVALNLSGGTLNFKLGSTLASNDSLSVGGTETALMTGTSFIGINVSNPSSFLATGSYTLISVPGGGLVPSDFQFSGGLNATTATAGGMAFQFSLSNSTSTAEVLTVTTGPVKSVYASSGSGDYNVATNWNPSLVPTGVDSEADFENTITGNQTVYSNSAITVGTMVFNCTSGSYVLAGHGPLTFQTSTGSASLNDQAGSHEITLPVVIASNTTFNAGNGATLVIGAPVTVNAGMSLTTTTAGTGVVQYISTITVNNGSSFSLTGGSNAAALSLLGVSTAAISTTTGTKTALQLHTLSIASGSTFDVGNNDLVVHGGSLSTIQSEIATGFNGGQWNGSGITSSVAASDSTHLTAVGVIQNTNPTGGALYSTFGNVPVSASDILVKETYYGDANLDGTVDGSDYSLIDNGFENHLSGWYNGDFNDDGTIDGSDYTLIDNTFDSQGSSLASQIASPDAIATAQLAGGTSAVPEPATLGLLGISLTGLLGRRRAR